MLEGIQPNSEYAALIDNYALFIRHPVLRFRFLREAISEYHSPLYIFTYIPCAKRFLYHLYIAKALYQTDKSSRYLNQEGLPFVLRLLGLYYKTRFIWLAIMLFVVGVWLYPHLNNLFHKQERIDDSLLIEMIEKQATIEDKEEENRQSLAIIEPQPQLHELMNLSLAKTLISDTIWMVESKREYELYSNGLRIFRDYEISTGRRCFLVFKKGYEGLPDPDEVHHDPVGIVYHTTESDILPFDKENNYNILKATRNLLHYIKRIKCYNYLIDRFGRVYRIVKEDHYAYHAGESIWSSGYEIYVNLNNSFIGVSFEGRSMLAGTMNEPSITPMQLVSARRLTDMLRQRYDIEDRNCVVHGIISVNSKNKIIGYHLDWAQDFPFELIGVSNKYHVPSPSILEFGFGYSTNMINSLGGKAWSGVYEAERLLKERAGKEKIRLGDLSFKLQARFDEMVDYQKSVFDKQHAKR
ncbi:MAG: peptidoglycan recognition family protein [bacterium]